MDQGAGRLERFGSLRYESARLGAEPPVPSICSQRIGIAGSQSHGALNLPLLALRDALAAGFGAHAP